LVAGDIFDTTTPPNKAQELYYQFLANLSATACRTVIITGGNHDSPSFLDAPAAFMRSGAVSGITINIVGASPENLEDEVIFIKDEDGTPSAIVCAVPYLRDRDIRIARAGESIDDKHKNMIEGIEDHYRDVCNLALEQRNSLSRRKSIDPLSDVPAVNPPLTDLPIPIIAMGHLFTAKGTTVEGDGVRELYVGSLACVDGDTFPPFIDYVALGHLHVPQIVGGREHIRYSGSPIPMGFGEARQKKSVVVVEFPSATAIANFSGTEIANSSPSPNFSGTEIANPSPSPSPSPDSPSIVIHEIPVFQSLERVNGTLEDIKSTIDGLKAADSDSWLEIEYTGKDLQPNLRDLINEMTADSSIEVLRISNRQIRDMILGKSSVEETLEDLNELQVFERCLDGAEIEPGERVILLDAFNEVMRSLHENDERES
jgi:exonuclease SbcD